MSRTVNVRFWMKKPIAKVVPGTINDFSQVGCIKSGRFRGTRIYYLASLRRISGGPKYWKPENWSFWLRAILEGMFASVETSVSALQLLGNAKQQSTTMVAIVRRQCSLQNTPKKIFTFVFRLKRLKSYKVSFRQCGLLTWVHTYFWNANVLNGKPWAFWVQNIHSILYIYSM